MISRRSIIASLGVTLVLGARSSFAAEQQYLNEAIAETKEAIAAGKQLLPDSLVEHATEAVDLARSAVWQNPTDHIRKGIRHLRKSIKLAKGTSLQARVVKATREAEVALTHLEAAK